MRIQILILGFKGLTDTWLLLCMEIGVTQLRYVTEIQKLYAAKAIRYNVNIA